MRRILTYGGYFEAFMKTLTVAQQKKIKQGLLLLRTEDRIPVNHVKLLEDGIFELRALWEGNIFRVFFIFDKGNVVVLFNGFQKKSQKTPKKELEKAKRIKKEYYGTR